jgi:hypothetical protein
VVVKAKTGTSGLIHLEGPPKKTRQGNGQHSRPRHNKKLRRGQGR